MKELTKNQIWEMKEKEKLKAVKLNPLTDYQAQVASNKKPKGITFGSTSLANHIANDFFKVDPKQKIYYKEELGNFIYSKIESSAAFRNLIFSFNASTQKVFLLVLFQLKYREDVVGLNLINMRKQGFKMSKNTYNESIETLCSNNIIKRVGTLEKGKDYWNFYINPQRIWKGDGKRFYNDVLAVHPEYLDGNIDL